MIAVFAACGGDGDGADADAGTDAAPASACAETPATGALGELDTITAGLEIHPVAHFDGEVIWLAYTVIDAVDSNVFDTAVARLDCDGALRGEPVRATTTTGRSEIDPVMAIGRDGVAVAWISDSGVFPNNLDIVIRAFDRDGAPLTESDITVEPVLADGTPVDGNTWDPALAPRPDGTFFLAGTTVRPGENTFRVFGQTLAADGTPTGALVELDDPGMLRHADVAVASGADGSLWFGWTETDGDVDTAMSTQMAAGAGGPTQPATPLVSNPSRAPSLSITASGERFAALRETTGAEADITIIATSGGIEHRASIGTPGAFDHTAIVAAASDTEGAVAYYRNLGGFRNQLVVVGFTVTASGIELGAPIEIAHQTPAPPYEPALTHVRDGVYFVAWAEGTSPAFSLLGELVHP